MQYLRPTAVVCIAAAAGCSTAYYSAWKALGYEKRDLLVSDVKTASEDQDKAKQQFKTTYEQLKEITHFNGGDLEDEYNKLNSEYEACESRAATVRKQIDKVQSVAEDFFTEWHKELDEYSDPGMRSRSEQELNQSRARYQTMLQKMQDAASRMQPVLSAFHDRVLFIKHNLNAQAIASLQTTSVEIDTNVSQLIKDMDASIAEADSFIGKMNSTGK